MIKGEVTVIRIVEGDAEKGMNIQREERREVEGVCGGDVRVPPCPSWLVHCRETTRYDIILTTMSSTELLSFLLKNMVKHR